MCTKIYVVVVLILCTIVICIGNDFKWHDINLPTQHLPYFFSTNPSLAQQCQNDHNCPYKKHLNHDVCWGYESNCTSKKSYSSPLCLGDSKGWVKTKEEQLRTFYNQADFGYVQEHRDQLKVYCKPQTKGDSMLECSDHLRFCRGKNIYLDLRTLPQRRTPVHYNIDVLKYGEIGGHCKLDSSALQKQCDMISVLQSWGPELQNFVELKKKIQHHSTKCDVWVDKPAYIMKLDATVNMYHHFCDFFNLYASQHVNNSDHWAFNTDNQILVWQTVHFQSNFGLAFKAFTSNEIWDLNTVSGKRVCFREVIFPLLPRMFFGLFYNTPLIWGCEKSGLFDAFSTHLLHRLKVPQRVTTDGQIHITLVSRQTKYRRILNENQLIAALNKNKNYVVRKAEYSHHQNFFEQLQNDVWTDIFIAMHGAGLTHLLFLPDWAVVFELYNCGDGNCYKDLARLRGIKYITWENNTKLTPQDEGQHPELGAHEKFTNYQFEVNEFVSLVDDAAQWVLAHPAWQKLKSDTGQTAKNKHTEL